MYQNFYPFCVSDDVFVKGFLRFDIVFFNMNRCNQSINQSINYSFSHFRLGSFRQATMTEKMVDPQSAVIQGKKKDALT